MGTLHAAQGMRIFCLLIMVFLCLAGCSNDKETEKGLAGYWDFNEGKGESLTDRISGKEQHIHYVFNAGNQPHLYKKPSDPLWRKTGVEGGSLLFDGYSTYIEQEGFAAPASNMTISLWAAPRAFEWGDQGNLSAFVSQGDKEKKEGFVFGMYRHGSWSLQLGLGDDQSPEFVSIWDNGHPLPKYEWSHVAATYDSAQGKAALYLNGNKINEVVFDAYKGKPFRKSAEKLSIGKYNHNVKIADIFDVNIFNGLMDELKIYNRTLAEDEIRQAHDSDLQSHEDSIPAIAYDEIGNDPAVYDGDRYRPQYHALPPGNWMNEPHAPIYYNGKYHLFYQYNPFGPFWHQIHWGHWVSSDMINWENVKEAVSPEAGELDPDGAWTGGSTLDRNGNPVLFVTAGNDKAKPNQRVGLYRPMNLKDPNLIEWKAKPEPIVVQEQGQGVFGEFRDPFVWKSKDKDVWYMMVGSGTNTHNGGTALVYSSTDLENWDFHGNVFESIYDKYKFLGEHWELPVLLPVQSADGAIRKDIFLISPHGSGADVEVYYWLGRFDEASKRFIPDHEEPRRIDYGDGFFTGPSGFVDPKTGRTILFTITQGTRSSAEDYYSGWAHSAGMPVSLSLDEKGELRVSPIEEVKNARKRTLLDLSNTTMEHANEALREVNGDLLEIHLDIQGKDAKPFGIKVRKALGDAESTAIYYDPGDSQLKLNRDLSSLDKKGLGVRGAPLALENGGIRLKIYLDRSQIEVYGNDAVSLTSRIFPTLANANGLELFGGVNTGVARLAVYEMGSVFTKDTVPPFYGK